MPNQSLKILETHKIIIICSLLRQFDERQIPFFTSYEQKIPHIYRLINTFETMT